MIGSKTRLGGMEQLMGGQKAIKESCTCLEPLLCKGPTLPSFHLSGKVELFIL